jgi:hypothetical protein
VLGRGLARPRPCAPEGIGLVANQVQINHLDREIERNGVWTPPANLVSPGLRTRRGFRKNIRFLVQSPVLTEASRAQHETLTAIRASLVRNECNGRYTR